MKKLIIIFIAVAVISVLSPSVFAEEDFFENSVNSIVDSVDRETADLLDKIGFESYSYQELYNVSFSDIADILMSIFKGSLKEPFKCISAILCISLIGTVGLTYINYDNSIARYLEMMIVIFISVFLLTRSIESITRTVSSIESLGIFMKALVPILAAVVSFSGNPALAVSYNAVTMYIAQLITAVCRDFLTPLLIIFTCVSVCLALNSVIRADSVLNMIKKLVNVVLGFIGTVFTGIISIKDMLASGADKVSVKGIKFLIGSSVPVVGSALSEGLSSVLASVSLMKNTLGIIGIIIIIVLVVPVVCELTVWVISLSFAGYFCEVISQNKTASVLNSFRFTFSMLLSILLFTVYILIVSAGMVILMGNK